MVAEAVAGDTWALIELIADRVARRAARASKFRGGCFDYEDYRQEARIAMWRACRRFKPDQSPLDAYLLFVAKRRTRFIYHRNVDAPMGIVGGRDDAERATIPKRAGRDTVEATERCLDLERRLAALPPIMPQLLALHHVAGYPLRHCAKALRASKSTLQRYDAQLRAALAAA
jgi:RNA polymerase sigma factor (sigma-70 family)